jgi:hypothetical protein
MKAWRADTAINNCSQHWSKVGSAAERGLWMNWEKIKKNIGKPVELHPKACFLDSTGREIPSVSDDWLILDTSTDQVTITNTRTHHQTVLAKDHVHHYTSNPSRSADHGIIQLLIQIFIQGNLITILPCPRPGERVSPPPVIEVEDKWVDLHYPLYAIAQRLGVEAQALSWVGESRVATLMQQGICEPTFERDENQRLRRLRIKTSPEYLTLVRRLPPR